MLKAPSNLNRASKYPGQFSKIKTFTTSPLLNNVLITKQVLIDKTAQIKAEIDQRVYAPMVLQNNSFDAIYIPTVLLRVKVDNFVLYKKRSAKLYMDNQASSALVYRNQKPVFVDSVLDSETDHNSDTEISCFLKRSPGHVITLIRAAKKISQHIFFLEFSGLPKYQRSFLGYFDRGQIKFIGMKFGKVQLFDNVDRLIDKIFGSKTKYQEIVTDNFPKGKLPNPPEERYRKQNLFNFLSQKIGAQTSGPVTITKLITYTAQKTAMDQCQRQILRYNLMGNVPIDSEDVVTDLNYVSYQNLIIDIFHKILTRPQFEMLFDELYHRSADRTPKITLGYKVSGMNISIK